MLVAFFYPHKIILGFAYAFSRIQNKGTRHSTKFMFISGVDPMVFFLFDEVLIEPNETTSSFGVK